MACNVHLAIIELQGGNTDRWDMMGRGVAPARASVSPSNDWPISQNQNSFSSFLFQNPRFMNRFMNARNC